jgi:hypothetical protein
MKHFIFKDYSVHYFTEVAKTAVPAKRQGKFIQVRRYSTATEYLVLSVRELSAYHANIAGRFFGEQKVAFRYNRKRDFLEIDSPDWEIAGGGMWEMDESEKTLKLSGRSQAYGAFDPAGLASRLKKVPALSGFRIEVNG